MKWIDNIYKQSKKTLIDYDLKRPSVELYSHSLVCEIRESLVSTNSGPRLPHVLNPRFQIPRWLTQVFTLTLESG